MHTEREKILYRAEFDAKWKIYWFLQIALIFLATVVGIVLIPFWSLGWGQWYVRRYYDRLSCVLGDRSLMFGRGIFFRVEKTIPLDRIQELTLREGPLLKMFGLLSLGVETAGQSAPAGSNTMKLVGIKEARAFRDRVLDQRDVLLAVKPASPAPVAAGASAAPASERVVELAEESNRVLKEILQELRDQRREE